MRANELMVGDWVQKLEVGGHYRKCIITGIFDVNVDCVTRNGEVHSLSISGIEPIPLTLEILQKNGFKTDGEAIWASFCPEDKEFALEISEPNYYDENYGKREYWWTINACEYSIIPLRYVHELQHALRLCGIEKEIVL